MDAQAYIDEMRAKQRRNLIIGIVVAVILAIIIVPPLFSVSGSTEYLDTEQTLAGIPALAPTQEEKALAGTILETDTFRSKLTYDAVGVTRFELEEVADIISRVLPADAEVMEIGVQGAVIYIDYQSYEERVLLQYVDADRSGSIDRIRKAVASPALDVYYLDYNTDTKEIQCWKGENWFE